MVIFHSYVKLPEGIHLYELYPLAICEQFAMEKNPPILKSSVYKLYKPLNFND